MDKARIVAEGSPRQLIERYATREVTELRFPVGVQETLDGQLDGLGERDRAPAGPRARLLRRRRGGRGRRPPAGPRAGDGAGPAQLARGRVPAADGPHAWSTRPMAVLEAPAGGRRRDPGRLRAPLVRRGVRAPVAALRPDLARVDLRQLRPAGPVPRRHGHRPRDVRGQGGGGAALGGVPYLQWLAPALLVSTVMQGSVFEATFPVIAGFHWVRRFHAMYATPLSPHAIAFGQLAWIATRATLVGTIFAIVIVLFGAAATPGIVWAIPVGTLTALAFAGPIAAFMSTPARHERVQLDLAVRDHAPVPVLGHVLPDRPAAPGHPAARLAAAPVARRGPRPRPGPRDGLGEPGRSRSPTS